MEQTWTGDADLAALGAVLAEPARARVLLALTDGRALPAGVLATEAGVAASTMSGHLARLLDAGLPVCRPQGRHRYYALAGPDVGELVEVLARLAPAEPVRSLKQGTRAAAVRAARTCYDHLAGRFAVDLLSALISAGDVVGGDGHHQSGGTDRLSARGRDVDYRLTCSGAATLAGVGVDANPGTGLRYCVDWTEQRHHLAGRVGRDLANQLLERGWLVRSPRGRAVRLTPAGTTALTARGWLNT